MNLLCRGLLVVVVACYVGFIALNGAPALRLHLWSVAGSELLLLLPTLAAVLSLLCAGIAFLARRRNLASSVGWLALATLLLLVPTIVLADKARMYAFSLVAARAEPVVDAVKRYFSDLNHPPESVEALVPKYLAHLPDGLPPLKVLTGAAARSYCEGNAWILTASVGTGVLNWDEFMYFDAQNYDSCRKHRSFERTGSWIYFFE